MKKITAIIGSPHLTKSNTCTLAEDFLKRVQMIEPEIDYEIISLGTVNVAPCRGCWGCTQKGDCIVKDDLPVILDKLSRSDMIMIGSPVYVDHISAQTKAFVDRIFIWLHTLRLIGKPSMTVLTTAGSGIGACEKYFDEILYLLGTIPVGHLHGVAYQPGDFPEREKCARNFEKLAVKVAGIVSGKQKLRPNLWNHLYFTTMKMKAHYGASYLPFEHQYWQEKGWDKLMYHQALAAQIKTREKAA